MEAKEKAEELFGKFLKGGIKQINPIINRVIRKDIVKQCALIAVEEILDYIQEEDNWYWQDVKHEIEKL